MIDHTKIRFGGSEVSFIPPDGAVDFGLVSFRTDGPVHMGLSLLSDSPVEWGLMHRAIGHILDQLQPGITSPVPDDSPDLVDAMKVMHEIDRLWAESQEVEHA